MFENKIKIKGKVQKGLGEAHNTIKEQMPYFKECFPEVTICKPGTINVLLEKPIVIVTPDFSTPPIPWHPAFKLVKGGETFSFVRITLEIVGLPQTNAWIYKAQFSPYRDNPYYLEILAPPLNFSGEPECFIYVHSQCYEGYIVIGEAKHCTKHCNFE